MCEGHLHTKKNMKGTCKPRRRRDYQQRRPQLQLCQPPLSRQELQTLAHFLRLYQAPALPQHPGHNWVDQGWGCCTRVTMTQRQPLERRAKAAASTSLLPDITSASVWLTQSMSVAAKSASGTSALAGAAFSTVVTPAALDEISSSSWKLSIEVAVCTKPGSRKCMKCCTDANLKHPDHHARPANAMLCQS